LIVVRHWPCEARDFLCGFEPARAEGSIPQKLTFAFSTADVVINGWRLGILADKLRENELATIHVLPQRCGDLDRTEPFVGSITAAPIRPSTPCG
jgi:hypothetical protein